MNVLDRFFTLARKGKHVLILGSILCIVFVMAGWVYMDNLRAASGNTTYEWYNDHSHTISEPIAADGALRQPFTTSAPVFGGGFRFTIYDQICHGTVTLSLENQDGETLTSTSMPTTELLDNTFQQMVFPTPVTPSGETTYTYVLTFTPETEESALGVWVSEEAFAGVAPYTLNGTTMSTGTAFAIVTNHAGNFILPLFLLATLFAVFALTAGYLLLFVWKAKLPVIFAFFALTLGLLYMFLIPPYVGPDEKSHIHTAYALSNDFLGIDNVIDETGRTYTSKRASDDIAFDYANEVDIFSYQTVAQQLFKPCEDTTIVHTDATIVYTEPPYLYLPTTIGLTLGRLLGFNYLTIIFLGRIMNLLCFTAIASFAIHLMPRFKRILCVVGLLPMSLQLASSFNYDAIIVATALLYTALVLNTADSEHKASWKRLITVAVLGVLLAPMKKLYVFLCLFCLIIPRKKCPAFIQKYIPVFLGLGVLGALALIPFICKALWITPTALAEAKNTVLPPANPLNMNYTENYYWYPSYLLTHILGAIKMVARTLQENTGLYFTQLVGGKAGEPILRDLPIWSPLITILYGMLALCTVPTAEETPLLSGKQKCWSGLLLLATLGGLVTVCLTWTPLRNTTIWGLQGRYLLPVLPLTLIVLQNNLLTLRQNIERALIFALACCNIIAMVSVFQQIVMSAT